MAQELTTRRENVGLTVMSYFILVAAGVVGLRFNPPDSVAVRWAVLVLLAAIAVVQVRAPRAARPRWVLRAYLGVYGVLVAALLFLQPGWTMFPILYATPIAFAILALPAPQGLYWTAAFTVVTATSFAVGFDLVEGVIALFLYGVIYGFIGTFAVVLGRADAARRESQALLAEQQATHRQLQEYAMRVEELAAVEERNRLSREMHDTLGHRLTVAAVQLEGAQRLCASDPERSAAMVGTAREQVREALAELRSTVAALRAPIEVDLHLRTSLRRLAAHFEQATGLAVHQVLPDELPPLPNAYRLALYRTAQEALTNVQRHAQASQVWLVLSATDTSVSLLVSDDGLGITLSREQAGFGLRGLGERAAELGGELHMDARRGGGTQLTFRLPLPVPAASEASGSLQGLEKATDVRTDPNPLGG